MRVALVCVLCAVFAVAGALYPKFTLSTAKTVVDTSSDAIASGAKMGKDAAGKSLAGTSTTPSKK